MILIAVGILPAKEGSADLRFVETVTSDIARHMNGYKVIVARSTVPIGTSQRVKIWMKEVPPKRGVDFEFDIVSN